MANTKQQAVGILILCHLLFKGHVGHRHPMDGRDRHAGVFRSKVKAMMGKHGACEEAPKNGAADSAAESA